MSLLDRDRLQRNTKASQTAQIVWLAFTALASSLAISGIPRYLALLQTPCSDGNCFQGQLTPEALQAWIASGQTLSDYVLPNLLILLLVDGLLLSTAVFLIWRKSNQRVSVLAAFVGTALATSTLSQALAHTDGQFRLPAQIILFVQMAGLLPLFCLFPDGRFQPRELRWVAYAYVLLSFIYLFPGYEQWIAPESAGYLVWLVLNALSLVVVVATLLYRIRGAPTSARQEQMLWLLAGIGLAALVVLLGAPARLGNFSLIPIERMTPDLRTNTEIAGMFLATGSFTCMVVAFFNYEPVNTDVLINRTLVYGALTVCIVVVYGLSVGYLGNVFHSDNLVFSLAATGLVAILFQPLRDRLQRGVNRLMYGERDEPERVLARLGARLENAIEPGAVLPLTVESIAHALKLPYVAILLRRQEHAQTLAATGSPQNVLTRFPLTYAGQEIGELVAGSRSANEPLTEADRRLLTSLTPQISASAHAMQLTGDLEEARLGIVEAGEEARRRLGNDLHDGVGHQLAGIERRMEIASNLLENDPTAARAALDHVKQQLNATMTQVRALAHQLHPPELELLGLVGALRERAQSGTNGFALRIETRSVLPALPTAIEIAAYYIALEALTNVQKHAEAQKCLIRLELHSTDSQPEPQALELEITDDGRGLSELKSQSGLGLLSMQARAAEVGGTCRIETEPRGGTRVLAILPLMRTNGHDSHTDRG